MRQVTIRQLQIFVEAAGTVSMARVAERLHISPAAVSFQIKQLESMTGFALFERIGRKVALTEAGAVLQGYAKLVLQGLQDADMALTALRGMHGGRVTIGLVSTAKYIAPHLLARFKADHPAIAINLRDGNRKEIIEALQKGEIDLAITGQPPPGADVVAEPFARHPSIIVAAPSHTLTAFPDLPLSVLVGEPFIVREEGSGTRMLMEGFFRAAGFSPRVSMTSSSNETIKQAVMAGMGLALISSHTVGLELGLGLLRSLPVAGLPLMRSWYVVHRAPMPVLPVHARLRAFLLEHGQASIDTLDRTYAAMRLQTPSPAGP